MNTINTKAILSTARGVDTLLPVLTGEQSLIEWAQSIAGDTTKTKAGRDISVARATLNGAQFAMTNMAMALRCATELGVMPYTQAVRETKRIYNVLDGLRSAFAGVRNEAHRELIVAEVKLSVKDGAFDSLQSTSDDEPYTEQELLEMGLNWEQIEEFMELQDAKVSLGQSQLMDTDGAMAEDEGSAIVGVHDANQLWDMELKDIMYAESACASVALIGRNWPTNDRMWDAINDRLADTWAAAIEYADDKEAMTRKIERRAAVLEDLHAKPMMARWVINHVTRRVFRDMAMLELKAEDVQSRLDWVERQALNEERYGVPASVTRQGTGEQPELTRKAYLMYLELDEAETARSVEFDTQVEYDRHWANAQFEAIEDLLSKLRPLYAKLRALDLSLAKLWEIFTDGERPAFPPVYWNMDRAFDDAEQAKAAIRIEMAMAKQKAREAEGDALVKAAAMVAEMLGL